MFYRLLDTFLMSRAKRQSAIRLRSNVVFGESSKLERQKGILELKLK